MGGGGGGGGGTFQSLPKEHNILVIFSSNFSTPKLFLTYRNILYIELKMGFKVIPF